MPSTDTTSLPARVRSALRRLVPQRRSEPSTGAKSSATAPLIAFESLRQPVWTPRDYHALAREGFAQNAIVYRCVRMIAEAAASVPLLLYEGDEEIEDHPLAQLIARPNAAQCGPDLLEAWYGFLLVAGNAYVEAVAIGGTVRELHVLRPDRMRIVPGSDGWPEAWEYTVGGRTVRLAADVVPGIRPVLHMKLFHPANDHYGMSPLEAAATAIDIHNAAARWNKALLDNSARPSGALVYASREGNLTSEQYERLKHELERGFQGAANAGRPLLLEGGLDWKSMSLSPKDLDFIEAKNSAAREIALALGVPPMLLGIPGDNTYSNMQEATRMFWRQTVLPLVARTAKALSAWLAPAYGSPITLRADLDGIEALSAEREALWTRIDKATFLTPNEKRAAAGYGPVTHGDEIKFNPDQPRISAGQPGGGRWTDGGGGGDSLDRIRIAQAEGRNKYSVDLNEEEVAGGHTKRAHVGKSDEYLLDVVSRDRHRSLFVTVARKSEGSFVSLESANDFVNRALEDNQAIVDLVASGQQDIASINKRFGYVTGKEAYRPDADSDPYMRDTYAVRVVIRHDRSAERGYRVYTAFPINQSPARN